MASSTGTLRSSCPVGFEPVNFNDSGHCPTEEDFRKSKSTSLWLIKVPHDFDVSSLDGQDVVLNGSQDLPSVITDQGTTKRYEIHSKVDSTSQLSSFSLLLPSSQENSMYSAVGGFNGQMNVIQSLSVPPSLLPDPPYLVSRESSCQVARKWKPFGYKNPRTNPSRVSDEIEKNSEKRKKKKKERKKRGEGNVNTAGKECDSSDLQLDKTKVHGHDKREKKSSPNNKKEGGVNGFHPARVKIGPTSCGEVEIDYEEKSACSSKTRKIEKDKHSEGLLIPSKHKLESKTDQADESESPRKRLRKRMSGETLLAKVKKTNGVDDFSLVNIKCEPEEVSISKKKRRK